MRDQDRVVFEGLTELFGIQNKFKDGVTRYVVCVADQNIDRSQKVRQSMRFRHRPAIVTLDWFIDSLEACAIMSLDGEGAKYLIDTSSLNPTQPTQNSRSNRS